MRPHTLVATGLALALMACSVSLSSPTPTPPPTATLTKTPTQVPTATPTTAPTPTRTPAPTFEPAPDLDAAVVETTLRAEGYKRYPFYDANTGADAFFWDNGSGVVFYTYDDGIDISFLNDARNLPARVRLIDKAIDILTPLFTSSFVDGLRQETQSYAERVTSAAGDPTIVDYGQEPWLGKLLEYNGSFTEVRNGAHVLPVYLRLLIREYKCDMSKYLYCYFYDMPSMTYTGEATLTFFNIWVGYLEAGSQTSG